MSTRFIGRSAELNWLEENYADESASFLILYGRRRIGKTETLRRFTETKPRVIFYTGTEVSAAEQLNAFSRRILPVLPDIARFVDTFTSWEQAFAALATLSGNQKTILVLDELPYIVHSSPELPSVLQKLWDETLRNRNIMIILCGSSLSFMEDEILGSKNPLYGRATGILKMEELNVFDACTFFPEYTLEEKLTAYALLGGIPHYLNQFDSAVPLAENIRKNILAKTSVLYSEIELIMHEEFREPAVYNAIITAIALGNTTLSDIHQRTMVDKTKLSAYLKNLMTVGIITREFPVTSSLKERTNLHRGIYRITDNYFRFYYRFVYPNVSELELDGSSSIYTHVIAPHLDAYTSRIFEDVALSYLRARNRAGELPFFMTSSGKWWSKTDEIDLVGFSETGTCMIAGECKYTHAPVDIDVLAGLERKVSAFTGSVEKPYFYLFSRSGFTAKLTATAASRNDVELVSLSDMFPE
ncbi:MAG TPA: ATP-binding protein [Methanocorpusculum sp.]|nr:ATP-binding protein [Methanocorpusculum sp.]